MIDISGWLTIVNLILIVGGTLGGIFAFRSAMASAERSVQERVIAGLKEEREGLSRKIEEMKRDQERCNSVISTIRYALKQRGLRIVIEGDFVTLSESNGKVSKVTRIQDRSAMLDDDTDAS